jgi:hypothetical protein
MREPNDWKAIARAQGIDRPDLEQITARVEALERIFRPAALELTPEQEPAAVFRADPEGE